MFCSQVLASADAELLKKKQNAALPTFDDMNAGTFARALASAAGRKGGRVITQMVADFRNPAITQPKQIAEKTKKILGGMGGHTDDAHTKACVAGGGSPPGGYDTAQATDAFKAAVVAGGGSPPEGTTPPRPRMRTRRRAEEGLRRPSNTGSPKRDSKFSGPASCARVTNMSSSLHVNRVASTR